jgi:two-component system, NtrC family, response regulator AtoC
VTGGASGAEPIRMLVVEDDKGLSEIFCEELHALGHSVVAATTVAAGLERLADTELDVVVLDLMLPDGSGIEVLRRIAQEDLPTEAIVLTGYADVSTAIEAMKLGAYDYITKPMHMEEVAVLVAKAAEKARLRRENLALRTRLERLEPVHGLITDDPGMKDVLATLDRIAASDLPVLVLGESGTGKELVARAVHAKSPRSSQAFVAFSFAAIAESLLESELFGYEKGAFTGAFNRKPGLLETADRGVLFLDEVGEATPGAQAKLLRAIETKEFFRVGATRPVRSDVRVVAATNKDLIAEVEAGRFREDLYYRINGVTLRLPALRDRLGDIPQLAAHFLKQAGSRKRLSARAVAALQAHAWPGNVRELRMVIHRAAVLSPKDVIEPEDLPIDPPRSAKPGVRTGLTLEEMEREYIEAVLKQHRGHRAKAAKALGINVKTLYNKLGPQRPRDED